LHISIRLTGILWGTFYKAFLSCNWGQSYSTIGLSAFWLISPGLNSALSELPDGQNADNPMIGFEILSQADIN